MSQTFWKELEYFQDFNQSVSSLVYHPFDPTWHLFITDIRGSTKAIEEGRYKDVNLVGALCIIAVLNACEHLSVPFVFGGDGAAILVPNDLKERTKEALLSTKEHAIKGYDLHLRVGSIQVKTLYQYKVTLDVAKYQVSKHYYQALFTGGGMMKADMLIKEDKRYQYHEKATIEANFSGLECRWKDVKSSKDETISLLIYAKNGTVYEKCLHFISEQFGSHDVRTPIKENKLILSFSPLQLFHEAKQKIGLKRFTYLIQIFFENILGAIFMHFNVKTGQAQWGKYKDQIVQTTDSEKFDDMLRMICSVNTSEREQLENFLQEEHNNGELCYGIHISDRALMTCLVFERMGNQVHFVDAADGGYAMAAKGLKKQLASFNKS